MFLSEDVHTETYKTCLGACAVNYGSQSVPNGGCKRWAVMNFRECSLGCFELSGSFTRLK
jgi:hypothetical protein